MLSCVTVTVVCVCVCVYVFILFLVVLNSFIFFCFRIKRTLKTRQFNLDVEGKKKKNENRKVILLCVTLCPITTSFCF
jgi:hypothetical protein